MGSMEINKAVAAFLVAGIAFMGAGLVSEALVHPKQLKTAAIKIDLPSTQVAGTAAAAAPEAEPPIAVLLASADAGRGEAGVKASGCVACHSFNDGGKAGVGPNLYGVMGAPHGHAEGYAYSAVLKAKSGPWTFEAMNEWLKKPAAYAPGTKMSYAGLSDPKKRADIIEYLRSNAKAPIDKPAAPVQQASATAPAVAAGAPAAPERAPGAPGAPPAGAATPPAASSDVATLLASANADSGKATFARVGCVACHSVGEGGKSGLGPNLYGIVNAPLGHMEGYTYSAALKAKGGEWSYAELDKWLLKPSAYAPGTKMSFAGIADPKARTDVIAYLRTLAATPAPLPDAPK